MAAAVGLLVELDRRLELAVDVDHQLGDAVVLVLGADRHLVDARGAAEIGRELAVIGLDLDQLAARRLRAVHDLEVVEIPALGLDGVGAGFLVEDPGVLRLLDLLELDRVDADIFAAVLPRADLDLVALGEVQILDREFRKRAVIVAAAIGLLVELDGRFQLAIDVDHQLGDAVVLVLGADDHVVVAIGAAELGGDAAVFGGDLDQLAAGGVVAVHGLEVVQVPALRFHGVGAGLLVEDPGVLGLRRGLLARVETLVVDPVALDVALRIDGEVGARGRCRVAAAGVEGEVIVVRAFLLDLDHHVPVAGVVADPVIDLGIDLAAIAKLAIRPLDGGMLAGMIGGVVVVIAAQEPIVVLHIDADRGLAGHLELVTATQIFVAVLQQVGLGECREFIILICHFNFPRHEEGPKARPNGS